MRATKATERGIALCIGASAVGLDRYMLQVVGVIKVTNRAGCDRPAQVGGKPRVGNHVDARGQNPAIVIKAHLKVISKAVALAGDHHVVIAIRPQFDGPTGLLRSNGGDAAKDG